jgi:hypothetical protein
MFDVRNTPIALGLRLLLGPGARSVVPHVRGSGEALRHGPGIVLGTCPVGVIIILPLPTFPWTEPCGAHRRLVSVWRSRCRHLV